MLPMLIRRPPRAARHAAAGPSGRPATRYYLLVLAVAGAAIAWTALGPAYYAWALGDRRVNVVVFCDTSGLDDPGLKALVYYDEVALHPLAHLFGLYQNRPPRTVKTLFAQPALPGAVTPVSITLKQVRYGPIVRLSFFSHNKRYYVEVPDRRVWGDTVYVRCPEDPAAALSVAAGDGE